MTNRRRKYEFAEKWVECLNCSQEYVIEYVIDERDTKGCPVCGSHAYEDPANEYSDWGD
ncbi:TPA: hypothetical protein QCR36_003975 [Bacillus cereus]|uniref:Hydrogenase maturation nickel metallochaperone HypA n=2 Tax=Bacillus thuringiensis TaxID=1428 RepID=A0AB35PA56_BACTU|nr:hypothetical protein BTF1_31552 [Bacillus thuringiensis HD-789]KAA8486434.1 hydrogenase maturation nickel metallochaperone HypA [Bacillus thuringiensis]MBG0967573.1 hydrogenase maturation nickel metallochaperone HypA [Bacillus sp. SRB3LM]RCX38549.1 hypothetical protein DEU45_10639 [Bacillus sp. AG102]TNP18999.1 hydrogenase maturation nickel metallochaperone HypA [Bacillus tropicus]HDR4826650.1 hypothetical protein [Bacillus cereus]